MTHASSRTSTLSKDSTAPPYEKRATASMAASAQAVLAIDDYVAQMLQTYENSQEQCMFLPSLMSLSETCQCSPVEIHQALSALKEQGCDFFIMGFESPITFWHPTRLGLIASA